MNPGHLLGVESTPHLSDVDVSIQESVDFGSKKPESLLNDDMNEIPDEKGKSYKQLRTQMAWNGTENKVLVEGKHYSKIKLCILLAYSGSEWYISACQAQF